MPSPNKKKKAGKRTRFPGKNRFEDIVFEDVVFEDVVFEDVVFEDMVREHQSELFATALRILGERTLAEDALQDTFMKAYRALSGLKPGSNPRAWLYRILVNTSYDQLDRKKTRTGAMNHLIASHEETQRGYDEQKEEDQEDIRAHVEEAIHSLPPKYRDPLLLRSIQSLPYSGVATALDIPETTARSLVHRGKRMLVPKLAHLMKDLDR